MKMLGDSADGKREFENLDAEEKAALKSLPKRCQSGEIVVCQTDKSGRFAVLSRQQYIDAGKVHIKDDREIDIEESNAIQRHLNGHMRWWSEITNLGEDWDQKNRSLRNLLNHGLAVCPMTILIKDHKSWTWEEMLGSIRV